ncbi:hypothetical protein D3C86_958340 [compost metagenome]
MIYGGLDFMGLPLEVLVKEYRRLRRGKSFPTLKGYADDFREYLSTYVSCDPEDHIQNAAKTVLPFLRGVSHEARKRWNDQAESNGKHLASKIGGALDAVIKDRSDSLKKRAWNDEFLSKDPSGKDRYDDVVGEIIDYIFSTATRSNRQKLHRLARLQLIKGDLSPQRTGIVVAGFGRDEMCPSLEAIETDGLIYDRLKYKRTESIDIGRRGPHAAIVGFAQDDMVGRFLNGVDPAYERHVLSLVKDLNDEFLASMEDAVTSSPSPEAAAEALAGLRTAFDHIHSEASEKIADFRNEQFRGPIIDMIRFMPNQELATLAASLIDLTSLKRRVSRERETVGGDVDVAVISKSEGFVWIKRKHYFPGDLNPRFFNRMRLRSEYGET